MSLIFWRDLIHFVWQPFFLLPPPWRIILPVLIGVVLLAKIGMVSIPYLRDWSILFGQLLCWCCLTLEAVITGVIRKIVPRPPHFYIQLTYLPLQFGQWLYWKSQQYATQPARSVFRLRGLVFWGTVLMLLVWHTYGFWANTSWGQLVSQAFVHWQRWESWLSPTEQASHLIVPPDHRALLNHWLSLSPLQAYFVSSDTPAQSAESGQSNPTPPAPVQTKTPKQPPSNLIPQPLEVSLVKSQFALQMQIVSIQQQENLLRFDIVISLNRTAPLVWYSDLPNLDKILLKTETDTTIAAVDVGGIFAQDTKLRANKTYNGWIIFPVPETPSFFFIYPDMLPTEIALLE